MSGTFPTLPGLDISVKRTDVYSTMVQAGGTGKEQRASVQATPRYRFELTFNFFRQTNFSAQTTFDELASLVTFFETQKGRWDAFNFTDPVDGTVRTCRFDQDELDIQRIVQLCWKGVSAVKLISTK